MKITIELNSIGELLELQQLLSGLKRRLPDNTPISDLGLDTRTLSVLQAEKVTTIGKLITMSDSDFLRMPNMGRKSLGAIREAMKRNGI